MLWHLRQGLRGFADWDWLHWAHVGCSCCCGCVVEEEEEVLEVVLEVVGSVAVLVLGSVGLAMLNAWEK